MKQAAVANPRSFRTRLMFAFGVLALAAAGLVARAVDLQLVHNDFLLAEGDQRYIRDVPTVAHRGMITDRNGEPLAVSTPVDSVSANPRVLASVSDQWPQLATALNRDPQEIARRLASSQDRSFLYLARHMKPADALAVRKLGMPGVTVEREYRRYYPSGEVIGHVLGFTSVDDAGQASSWHLTTGSAARTARSASSRTAWAARSRTWPACVPRGRGATCR